jgi:phosphatidylinositol alpha-1,6-mannosyltransferase
LVDKSGPGEENSWGEGNEVEPGLGRRSDREEARRMSEGRLEISFIAHGFPPGVGGTELYNEEYARRLHERGHSVRVFTWAATDPRQAEMDAVLPFEIHREPLRTLGKVIDPRGIEAALLRWKPEVIFISRGSRRLGRVVPAAAECAPVVLSMHELSAKHGGRSRIGSWRIRQRYGLHRAARVTVNSEDTRARLLALGVSPERVAIVHPGVDVSHFVPDLDAGEQARKELGLIGTSSLLTVSRLSANKGHERVIDLLPRLRSRVPNLVYVIVGEGRERPALERRAAERRVKEMVRFEGFVPDVRRYYNACDVFVMASSRSGGRGKAGEGFGITYVEAGACGMPVVASASGGGAEVIIDGETGCVVDPQDDAMLEAVLLDLLTDRRKARCWGENGRRRVARYDWNNGLLRLEQVLRAATAAP